MNLFTSIFIDAGNMFHAQQKQGWFFDPKKIIKYAVPDEHYLVNAWWHTAIKDEQDNILFRDALTSMGYSVMTRPLKEYYDPRRGITTQHGNCDVDIVIDMVNTWGQYQHAVVFTGDGDFLYAFEQMHERNIKVTVVGAEGMISRDLRSVPWINIVYLDQIKEHIIKIRY
jgi:uncharacterized LabA/DUF88 family protein